MKKIGFIAILISFLWSCQTEIYYTRSVINDTDFNLDLVIISDDTTLLPDTIRLEANSTTVIEDFHESDRPKDGYRCAPERGRVEVRLAGFDALLRDDFFDDDNWEKYIDGNRSMEQDCYFQIDNDNLLLYNGS